MKHLHEIVWWKNGKFMNEFKGDLEDEAALFRGDGFAYNTIFHRVTRRIRGKVRMIDLAECKHHLSVPELIILVRGLLMTVPSTYWNRWDILTLVKHPRPEGRHVRTLVNRWMMDIRWVIQDGDRGPFLLTARCHVSVGAAWYLNPHATYVLLHQETP